MPAEILMLLWAPAAGLVADVAMQAMLPRLAPRSGPIRLQFLSFGAGAAVTLALLAGMLVPDTFAPVDKAGYLALHFLIYACFGFCFFNVISANVSSLRVRILREMLARHPAPIGNAVLREQYSAREMLAARLERLERGGQIEARDGRYYLRKSGISAIGSLFAALRRLLLKA